MEESKRLAVLHSNIREVMKSRGGQELIWEILGMCNIDTPINYGGEQTFMAAGRQEVGFSILKLLEDADPTIYPNMLLKRAKECKDE